MKKSSFRNLIYDRIVEELHNQDKFDTELLVDDLLDIVDKHTLPKETIRLDKLKDLEDNGWENE